MTAPLAMLMITITRIGRAISAHTLWFVIALDFIGFLIIWFEIHRYRDGRRRGETAATTFMWFGLISFLATVFKWDVRGTHEDVYKRQLHYLSRYLRYQRNPYTTGLYIIQHRLD